MADDPTSHVNCPSCGHQNPDAARFCGECGSSLETPCPACGHENPAEQRFCNGCGEPLGEQAETRAPNPRAYRSEHLTRKLAASARALEGERKHVTVLFLDVQGSMGLAESVGPEAWRSTMGHFFELVCEEVHRFDGTVDKFTGDGAMALFGAPIAQEDHASTACHVALHLRDRLHEYSDRVRREHGLGLPVRIGLNSGEVVVGSVGSDLDPEYTAIGNTVGLAARMESLAEPGRPYLAAATARLVEGYFELDDLGDLQVKGMGETVHAYALLGVGEARTRLEVARGHGLSRFVGRDEELATLEAALERAERSGQAVGVVAEPGLGKSRLCGEFVERCRERGIDVTEGRGVAHGGRVPLLPVIEMLRAWFGVAEEDEAREVRQKVAGRLLLLDERFRDMLPVLFEFLGVPDPELSPPRMSPEARKRALFGVTRKIVEARAGEGPAVMLVEDLHWLDPGSDTFLENLVESLPASRTLLIVNFRPEYRASWTGKSYYQQLPLLPLTGEALDGLLSVLLGDDPSVDGLAELIADRTGGNPFFVEEVVQGLVENGTLAGDRGTYRLTRSVDAIEIPPTVQAVLAARIDRLAEREKAVLQSAAVVGREFSEPVLRAVTGLSEHDLGEALRALRVAELVYEQSSYPEAEYAFKHPLTEEVAYGSQLTDRRARVHAAAADAIEILYADRLDELAALIAGHRERAGDPLAAARLNARAAAWAGQHNPADALRHWRRVRSLLQEQPPSSEIAGLRLSACLWTLQFGWRLGVSGEEIEEVSAEGMALAEASGEKAARAALLAAASLARGMRGDAKRALRDSLEAESLASEAGALEIQLGSGAPYWTQVSGELEQALVKVDEMLERMGSRFELGRETVGFSFPVWMTWFRGLILVDLGRLGEGAAWLERALELAREHDDPESLGWAHMNLATLAYYVGESGDALAHAHRAVELAERLGSSFSRATAYTFLALAHYAGQDWDQGLGCAERGLDEIRRTGTGLQYEGQVLSIVAEGLLELGQPDAARLRADEGTAAAARSGTPVWEARNRWVLGRALVAMGDVGDGTERELTAALDVWERMAPGNAAFAHEALADLAAARRESEEQARRLELALALYAGQGAHGRERRVAERLSKLGRERVV